MKKATVAETPPNRICRPLKTTDIVTCGTAYSSKRRPSGASTTELTTIQALFKGNARRERLQLRGDEHERR